MADVFARKMLCDGSVITAAEVAASYTGLYLKPMLKPRRTAAE